MRTLLLSSHREINAYRCSSAEYQQYQEATGDEEGEYYDEAAPSTQAPSEVLSQ